MYTQLCSQDGPSIPVICDVLKYLGLDIIEEDIFYPYYAVNYDGEVPVITEEFWSEFLGFLNNGKLKDVINVNTKALYLLDDIINSINCKLIFIDYNIDIANSEFFEAINEQEYNKHLALINKAITKLESNSCKPIHVDYYKFITDAEYAKESIKEITGKVYDEKIVSLFLSQNEEPSPLEQIIANRNDDFARSLVENVINE